MVRDAGANMWSTFQLQHLKPLVMIKQYCIQVVFSARVKNSSRELLWYSLFQYAGPGQGICHQTFYDVIESVGGDTFPRMSHSFHLTLDYSFVPQFVEKV